MPRHPVFYLLLVVAAAQSHISEGTELAPARSGSVEFQPADGEQGLPERFRLAPHVFTFEETPLRTSSRRIRLSKVTFPSGCTSSTRQALIEVLTISAVSVVPETVVLILARWTTSQRRVSPGWNR